MKKELTDIWKYLIGLRDFDIANGWQEKFVYPIDLEWYLNRSLTYYSPIDKDGIPMSNYKSVGLQYNPTRVSSYGLAHWNRYILNSDEKSLNLFFKISNWFIDIAKKRNDCIVWEYNFDWGDLKKPWISAMAQGEVISLLSRAYYKTKEQKYIDIVLKAIKVFTKDIDHGGVCSKINGNNLFFEEYPSQNPKHELNGFLYAVIGLTDLAKLCSSESILQNLIIECKKTLEECCKLWDLGYWSAYDLSQINGVRNSATTSYHLLHIAQITFLSDIFESEILSQQAKKWKLCFDKLTCRLHAVRDKIRYRILCPPQR
jgi:hypothetical protein